MWVCHSLEDKDQMAFEAIENYGVIGNTHFCSAANAGASLDRFRMTIGRMADGVAIEN
jgi:hypothetical protein